MYAYLGVIFTCYISRGNLYSLEVFLYDRTNRIIYYYVGGFKMYGLVRRANVMGF